MHDICVIPKPKYLEFGEGYYDYGEKLVLSVSPRVSETGILEMCQDVLKDILKVIVSIEPGVEGDIHLELVDSWRELSKGIPAQLDVVGDEILSEGYELKVTPQGIFIRALSPKGLYYGIATLIQLTEDKPLRAVRIVDWPSFGMRGVHLDLKVQMPKTSYLHDLTRRLSLYKVNTLLIEYEDKFPYRRHSDICSEAAFAPEELRELLDYARKHHMTLVPLIQSLGHMEYVLRHDTYRSLREKPNDISQMCPLNPGSKQLFRDFFAEVLEFHARDKFFHIGGDETWVLGSCPRCRKRVEEVGFSGLYIEYMNEICDLVQKAGKTPVIWSDMLSNHPEAIDRFPKDAVINYWDYWSQGECMPFVIWNAKRYTMENLAEVPEHIRKIYDPYWFKSERAAEFKSFPYLDFFLDNGYSIISSPATRSFGDSYNFPSYLTHIPNIVGFAKASAGKTPGIICTSWAIRRGHPETTFYGLVCAAETMWNPEDFLQSDFDNRFATEFFGLNSSEVIQAFYLLSRTDPFGRPFPYKDAVERAKKALALIEDVSPCVRRNLQTWEHIKLAGYLCVYETATRLQISMLEGQIRELLKKTIKDPDVPNEVEVKVRAPWLMK